MQKGDVIVFFSPKSRLNNHNNNKKRHNRPLKHNQTAHGYVCKEAAISQKVAETQLRGGMASRQGGSFNSVLGRRKSPLASLSSEQQESNLRGKEIHINKRFWAYFSRAWPSDGTGVPLPLGNIVLCGRTPAVFLFFIAISSVRSSRPRPSRTPTALLLNPTTEPGPGGRGGARAWRMLTRTNERAPFRLRSAFSVLSVCCSDADSCDINECNLKKNH